VNGNTVPTEHRGSLQQKPLQSSLSDQQAAAPLTKRRFADRGIRIVALALGGDLCNDVGCIAITLMPSAAFYSRSSDDPGQQSRH
jgi:hypothetical protein